MNPIRGLMSRFYRDHGLPDPEAAAAQPFVPRTTSSRVDPDTSVGADDEEIQQLRAEIDTFSQKSERDLREFRASLATHLRSVERVQHNDIRAKEEALDTERTRQRDELTKLESTMAQQELRLADTRKHVLQMVQARLQNVHREPAPTPPRAHLP